MEYNDRFKAEIERLGKALANVLNEFLKLKKEGQITDGMATLEKEIGELTDLDLKEMQTYNDVEDLRHFLNEHPSIQTTHFDMLSVLLTEYAENPYLTRNQRLTILHQALNLTQWAMEEDRDFSIEKDNRLKYLQKSIVESEHDADDH